MDESIWIKVKEVKDIPSTISGIYALLYKGEYVYIGKSRLIKRRVLSHLHSTKFKSIYSVDEIRYFECNNNHFEEVHAILTFKPKKNIQGAKYKKKLIQQ